MIAHRAHARHARDAARAAGELTFTGTRCRAAAHDGTRYTSTGACVACMTQRYDAARLATGRPEPKRRPRRHDATRHDATRHDATRHDATRHDATRHDDPGTQLAVACIL